MACLLSNHIAGQAPERPRHIRGPLPLLRSRPGGVCSLAIARRPEPDKNCGLRTADCGLKNTGIRNPQSEIRNRLAERVGFEPTVQFPVHSISSAASSATPAPLLENCGLRNSDCGLRRFRIRNPQSKIRNLLAERVGFEPTVPLRVQRFSRPPDSTTLAPLRMLSCITSIAKKRL